MKILSLVQDSPEWHAHRANARNASEAAAMLGFSKYMTRSDLVRMKATGTTKTVNDATQALFDRGHESEALARPNIESELGEDLYPATATSDDGYLSASFDGITMDESQIWENKLFNKELADYIRSNSDLPDTHWPQVEQQLIISGAFVCIFTLCDDQGNIQEKIGYLSKKERRDQIIAGWKQFDQDVANYQHVEEAPKAVADAILDLPAVVVNVSGELSIKNNFDIFETALRDFIDNQLILKPETDQDFANLDAQIKTLKRAEEALNNAEAAMLSQVSTIDDIKRTKDMLHKLARDNRLMAEKLLDQEKTNRRVAIQEEGKKAYQEHVSTLNKILGNAYMPTLPVDFVGVTKGKKTIASIKDAVNVELARAKIAASEVADKIAINLQSLRELAENHKFLFSDVRDLVLKNNDDLVNVIKVRIADHDAQLKQKIQDEIDRQTITQTPPPAEPTPPPKQIGGAGAIGVSTISPAVSAVAKKEGRPSDGELIEVLALHYRVHESKVIAWLLAMNLEAESKKLAAAV